LQVSTASAQDIVQLPGETQPLILGNGGTIDGYFGEPYPEVCYSGGYVFLPSVVLGGKVSQDLGWSLGFVPPDINQLAQWGGRDGTVQTPTGRRPSPTRYTGVHQNATFLTLQGALGYRIAPWLRIGGGVRWSMVVFQGSTMATTFAESRKAADDGFGELTGRDLFIPGFNVSLHAIPAENLDVALGFRWEDAMRVTNPKLDVITNVWGPGRPVEYNETVGQDVVTRISGAGLPVATDGLGGVFSAPPLIVPQLSFSLRYADRIVSRRDQDALASDDKVGDSMDTERWDIELDGIYYMTSVIDQQTFTFKPGEGVVRRTDLLTDGSPATLRGVAGKCAVDVPPEGGCPIPRQNIRPLGGRDQWTFRLGGDINIIPSRFAVRAGVSYEQRGVDPNQVFTGNSAGMQRTGLHAGFTLRFGKTDFSASYAHFMSETIEIAFSRPERIPARWRTAEYNPISEGDAAAFAELQDNDSNFGPTSVNAGTHSQSLDVVAIGLAQHF
jgi:long-subunit fatty acid transport protein